MHNRLSVLRAERGVSRRVLAEAIGVNPQTIGYIERGDYGPSLELGLKIAAFFGAPVDVLFSLKPFRPLADHLAQPIKEKESMTLPRSIRRLAVVSMYGAYLAGGIMQWRVRAAGQDRQVILATFLFAFVVGAFLFVSTHYMRWTGAKENALDEREIVTRNAVYRTAYSLMAWFSFALLAWWYVGRLVAPPLTPETDVNAIFWGWVLLFSTLPASLLAWKDRPPQ